MSLLEECQEFVKKVDTLVPLSDDHELNLLRKLSNILEEKREYEIEEDEEKKQEEMRDVQFYELCLLNYLDKKFPHFKERKDLEYIKSYEEYFGLMKKNLRKYGNVSIDECEFKIYNKVKFDLLFNLESDFIKKTTEKLLKKFPEHCKTWGLL